MMPSVVPVVEGHGEIECVPLLLRRIAERVSPALMPRINPPTRVKASSFLNDKEYFNKYINLAAAKAKQSNGLVLILLDCEDYPPCQLGPRLLQDATSARPDVPYLIALAFREFETWFIHATESLKSCSELKTDTEKPITPESLRDAKGWIKEHRAKGYDPIVDQTTLAAKFNLDEAISSKSFERLLTRISKYYTQHLPPYSE